MKNIKGFDRLGEEQKKNQHFCVRHGEIKFPTEHPAGGDIQQAVGYMKQEVQERLFVCLYIYLYNINNNVITL